MPRRPSRARLLRALASLFWDHDLRTEDLDHHPDWVLGRVLMYGDLEQVRRARAYYGDAALRRAIARRGIDARTRGFWALILDGR